MSTYSPPLRYDAKLEQAVVQIELALQGAYRLSRRAIAILLLQRDPEVHELVRTQEAGGYAEIERAVSAIPVDQDVSLQIALNRREAVRDVLDEVVSQRTVKAVTIAERISRICTSPITGIPVMLLVTWFVLYQFVGMFAGGTLVGLLEDGLFGGKINPWVSGAVSRAIPWPWLQDLFIGDYGLWTLGVTYAVALVFPIVGCFFLAFSILEDTGYLPRLAMLIDRLFKMIGLNGKAVIPIVLGFGCDTMATIVTRILETPRERIIATFLLSLAIPCTAQIGLMTALLAGHPAAFGIWLGIMVLIFMVIGWLTAKLLPGESGRFSMEIPPMRLPRVGNILIKTIARMQWYFMEVLPLFLFASVAIWLGRLTGLFDLLIRGIGSITWMLGLPKASAEAFLFGFFRRDYGSAGLYKLNEQGALNGNQLLICVVTLTIFLPCVAQFLVMKKERGLKMTLMMSAFIFPFALFVGAMLNLTLNLLHLHV